MSVRLVTDLSDIERTGRAIGRLRDRLEDLTPLMRTVGAILATGARERFGLQSDPEGRAWQPLSEVTIMARLGGKRRATTKRGAPTARATRKRASLKILSVSMQLRDSITSAPGPEGVEVGTNKVYGGIQQHGGQAGRGRAVTIPAREYLGISDMEADGIEAAVQDYLRGAA